MHPSRRTTKKASACVHSRNVSTAKSAPELCTYRNNESANEGAAAPSIRCNAHAKLSRTRRESLLSIYEIVLSSLQYRSRVSIPLTPFAPRAFVSSLLSLRFTFVYCSNSADATMQTQYVIVRRRDRGAHRISVRSRSRKRQHNCVHAKGRPPLLKVSIMALH